MMKQVYARDIMNTNIISVREDMTTQELAAFLTEKGISGSPVVNDNNEYVGVVSLKDLAGNTGERTDSVSGFRVHPEFYDRTWEEARSLDEVRCIQVENSGQLVRDIMTPAIFTVTPDTPIRKVADTMVRGRIHRVLVSEGKDRIVGIISTLDLLKLMAELGDIE